MKNLVVRGMLCLLPSPMTLPAQSEIKEKTKVEENFVLSLVV
jgi:hypothetical protein